MSDAPRKPGSRSPGQIPGELPPDDLPVSPAAVSWRQTFAALRHRNFRLFFFGQLVSLIGTWMQNTAQSWLIYQLTGSKLLLGVVAAVSSAPMLFFSIWGGSVADRHPKRGILLWTQSALMVLAFVMAGLVWTEVIAPWHILVLSALAGTAMAFDMPARQSFIMEMTSRQDLMNAVSLNSSIVNGARVVGPAVAGLIMAAGGMAICFFLNGLSFLAVIAGLLWMRLPAFAPPARPESTWQHIREGFVYVAQHRRVRVLLLLFLVVGVFGWSYSVLMPAFAKDVLQVDNHDYGLLLSANGLGALAGALAVAALGHRIARRRLVFGGLGVFSVMLLLLGFTRSFAWALLWMAIAGWGMLLYFSTTNTLLQTSVTDDMRGRVMGIWALIFGGMLPLGGLEAGACAHFLGVPATVSIGAVVCGAAALVTWLAVRRTSADPGGFGETGPPRGSEHG